MPNICRSNAAHHICLKSNCNTGKNGEKKRSLDLNLNLRTVRQTCCAGLSQHAFAVSKGILDHVFRIMSGKSTGIETPLSMMQCSLMPNCQSKVSMMIFFKTDVLRQSPSTVQGCLMKWQLHGRTASCILLSPPPVRRPHCTRRCGSGPRLFIWWDVIGKSSLVWTGPTRLRHILQLPDSTQSENASWQHTSRMPELVVLECTATAKREVFVCCYSHTAFPCGLIFPALVLHSWNCLWNTARSPPFPHHRSPVVMPTVARATFPSFLVKQRDFPGNVRSGGCDSLPAAWGF